MLLCKVHDLRDFGLRDFIGKDAANADAPLMDMKHNLHGFLMVLAEEAFEHVHDKLHRCVVVIQHDDLVHGRFARLRFGFDDNADRGIAVVGPIWLLVAHDLAGLLQSRSWVRPNATSRPMIGDASPHMKGQFLPSGQARYAVNGLSRRANSTIH